MKKLLHLAVSFVLLFGVNLSLKAQSSILFCEDFNTIPWQMTTSGNPAADAPLFTPDSNVYRGGMQYSATDTVGYHYDGIPIQSYLTTPVIYGIDTPSFVGINFYHIAYIETADRVYAEVTFDNGNTWIRLNQNYYEGSSTLLSGGGFSKLSRPFLWKFIPNNDTNFIWNNNNAAWIQEEFDLQPLIDANNADSMQVRIVLEDNPSSFPGRVGEHRYYIDDFCVFGSDCPPGDPELTVNEPDNYPNQYINNVYLEGPYRFNVNATSPSTIDSVYVEYTVKRDTSINGGGNFVVVEDSIAILAFKGGTSYQGEISANSTQIGDSVFWRVKAIDASPCANVSYDPNQGYNEFEVRGNLPISCNTTPISSLPYVETFDNWIMTSNLGNMQNDWQNVEGDFHDWWLWRDSTPTPQTGPKDDYPGGGQYLYVETTGYYDSTAFLLTPCIDFSEIQNAKVRFYLHQLTDGTDTVWVDVFNTTPQPGFPYGRYDENIVPPIPGNKGDRWLPVEFTTFPYRGKVTQIRIRAKPSKTSEQSDIALDSFSIVTAPLVDLRAERVVIGPYLPEGEQTSVVVNVQNQGVYPTDSITFNYDVIMENTGQVYDSGRNIGWKGVIPPGEDSAISLDSKPFITPLGQYTIVAWLEYAGDEVPSNDTTQQRTYGLALKDGSFYFETFDEPNRDTIFTAIGDPDTLTNFWEFGTPSYDKTNSAFSTQSYNTPYADFNCWDILLDRPFIGDGNTVQLVTPFIDFSNAQNPILSFFNNRDIDLNKAGVYIEYSLDRGFTWDSVPAFNDPGRKKWYNSSLSAGGFGGQPIFSGTTRHMLGSWNGWVESELRLPTNIFAGQPNVLFRFMFFAEDFQDVANGFNSNDGMSIDNFHVFDEMPTDIEVQHIIKPVNECDLDSIERFTTAFKNRGQSVINTFDVQYVVKHIPTNTTVTKSETVNKTIQPRDTGIVESTVDFDMRALGDYEVKVIVTNLQGDAYSQNDTAIKYVENIDGCWMVFEAVTAAFERPQIQDSSYWRFEYTSGGREYYITDNYEPFEPFDTNRIDVCFRKNADVVFDLGDIDTAIVDYSLYAYDGEEDTIFVQQQFGGPESPIQEFHWVCPFERTAKTIAIYIDNEDVQPPIAKDYLFEMEFLNNGLDSIREIYLGMSIDGVKLRPDTLTIFNAPVIEYNRKSGRIGFGFHHLGPGRHEIKAWTHDPNFKQDQLPEDDTLTRYFTILDTFKLDGDGTILDSNNQLRPVEPGEYCTDFEFDNPADSTGWLFAKFPNWYQEGYSFEMGTPSTPNINGARSGNNAMVTDADDDYINFDSSAAFSPLIPFKKDSCYLLSFYHNYYFEGDFNDGAQVLLSLDTGFTWKNLNRRIVDVGDTLLQQGWYNTRHVIAIEDNNKNAGWSGQSGGWVHAQTYIPSYSDAFARLAFRFASDGNYVADGWAIDDFCMRPIDPTNCFAVGLGEKELDEDQLYLGQSVPNPAVTNVEIPYYLPKSGNVYFEVTNMMGQKVREMNMSKSHGNHLMKLDVSGLGSGVYYYWIIFEGQKLSKKMIITK